MNHYETVFILNPVLSEDQIKEAVNKFELFLNDKKAKFINKEKLGLEKNLLILSKIKKVDLSFI